MAIQSFIPLLSVAPLVIFYLWMFRHMLHNDYLTSNPWVFFGMMHYNNSPPNLRFNWTMAFLLLNVFAAALYYFVEYGNRP
jgi:hypothetical protein